MCLCKVSISMIGLASVGVVNPCIILVEVDSGKGPGSPTDWRKRSS